MNVYTDFALSGEARMSVMRLVRYTCAKEHTVETRSVKPNLSITRKIKKELTDQTYRLNWNWAYNTSKHREKIDVGI